MPGRVGQCERCGLPLRYEAQDRVRAAYRGCVGDGFRADAAQLARTAAALDGLRKKELL